MIFILHQCHLGDEIKKNDKRGAHSTYGRQERCKRFWWKNLGNRDHVEYLRLYGRITLEWIFRLIQIIHMTPGQQSGKN